jgi:hypothetical protein
MELELHTYVVIRVFNRRLMSQDISEDEAGKLLENRTKFKLFAAEQHLNNLKRLEQEGSSMRFFRERVRWEMEIESFLFHIVGVFDSLLAKINNNWELRLKRRDINIDNIKIFLKFLNEQALLMNLANFNGNTKKLRGWRNRITHENLLNIQVRPHSAGEPEIFFVDDPNKKLVIIPLLENEFNNVKGLVEDIVKNEPRLE